MVRRSSLHGHFVQVKTHMGLEKFEVGKSRNRYAPFRSCLGKGRCRPVNSIPWANICLDVDARCNWRDPPGGGLGEGGGGGGPPPGLPPFSSVFNNDAPPHSYLFLLNSCINVRQMYALLRLRVCIAHTTFLPPPTGHMLTSCYL